MSQQTPSIKLPGKGTSRQLFSEVFQSPLAGVSDQVFRRLVRRWAPDTLLFTEMVNAKRLDHEGGINKIKEISNEEGPIGVQLFDYRPKEMAAAAKQAEGEGAFLIDINMGCPVRKITCKGGGSALLKNPELAAEIVQRVAEAVKIPVTVKTRIGWSNHSSNGVSFALKMEQAGAQLLTLHGRTKEQGFNGEANWNAIAQVKKSLKIPVIANGDIFSPADALNCKKITNANGVMIGRGSMGAPWVVGQIDRILKGEKPIETPSPKERIEIAIEQLEELLKKHGDHGLYIARKHLSWICTGFPNATSLRSSLVRIKDPIHVIKLLENQIQLFEKG